MTGPRLALLGYGAIAELHARALARLDCSLVAVMGPNLAHAQRFAADHGVASATVDFDEVLAMPDVDAVVVASPNDVHAAQAEAALRAGKHVLCEVPLAMSYADAERAAAGADRAGLELMVCHTQRFWAPVQLMRRQVEEGHLVVHHVLARTLIRRWENVGWTGRRRSWVDHLLWHQGSHLVDTALWLTRDTAEHVSAEAGRPQPETGLPMDLALAIRTSSGAIANLALSFNALTEVSDLLVIGANETFRLDGGSLTASTGTVLAGDSEEALLEDAMQVQDEAFVRAVDSGTATWPRAADVLDTYQVLQQASDRVSS